MSPEDCVTITREQVQRSFTGQGHHTYHTSTHSSGPHTKQSPDTPEHNVTNDRGLIYSSHNRDQNLALNNDVHVSPKSWTLLCLVDLYGLLSSFTRYVPSCHTQSPCATPDTWMPCPVLQTCAHPQGCPTNRQIKNMSHTVPRMCSDVQKHSAPGHCMYLKNLVLDLQTSIFGSWSTLHYLGNKDAFVGGPVLVVLGIERIHRRT